MEMRTKDIEGRAEAAFVIDTTGDVIFGTAIITQESDFAFGSALCAWFRAKKLRFEPFTVEGRTYAVRMINFPVEFTLGRGRPP